MKNLPESDKKNEVIYINIDHLKQGKYELKILLKNKVLKSVSFQKNEKT